MIMILYFFLVGKWEDIYEELCISNVIQRDSVLFGTRLHPVLQEVAETNEKEVELHYYK